MFYFMNLCVAIGVFCALWLVLAGHYWDGIMVALGTVALGANALVVRR